MTLCGIVEFEHQCLFVVKVSAALLAKVDHSGFQDCRSAFNVIGYAVPSTPVLGVGDFNNTLVYVYPSVGVDVGGLDLDGLGFLQLVVNRMALLGMDQ